MNRRDAIKMGAALSSIAALSPVSLIGRAVANAETDLGKVKITDVKTASIRLGKYDTELVKVLVPTPAFMVWVKHIPARLATCRI